MAGSIHYRANIVNNAMFDRMLLTGRCIFVNSEDFADSRVTNEAKRNTSPPLAAAFSRLSRELPPPSTFHEMRTEAIPQFSSDRLSLPDEESV